MVVLLQAETVALALRLGAWPEEHEGVAGAELLAAGLTGGGVIQEGGLFLESLEYLLVHRGLI